MVDLAKGPPDLIRAAGLVNSREAGMYCTKPGTPYKAHKAGDFCRPGDIAQSLLSYKALSRLVTL